MTTKERLTAELQKVHAPAEMIDRAAAGCYDDFESDSASPICDLVCDAIRAKLPDIARRAMTGEFDSTREEAEAWIDSLL